VSQCRRSNSSSCKVPKKLSAMALSRASPIEPIEPRMPAARNRLPKAQEVLRAVVGVHHRAGLAPVASPDGHLQGVDDELGAEMIRDRPADDATREGVDHSRQVDLA